MLSITLELAQRLESAEALDAADCAEAQCLLDSCANAAVLPLAGGVAAWVGADSPLSHAVGLGLHGPVTETEIDQLEDFFRSRETPTTVDVCPHADTTLLELLTGRGYLVREFANVMVRRLSPGDSFEPPSAVETRPASAGEAEDWAFASIRGFFGRESLTEAEERIGRVLFQMQNGRPMFALIGGEPAGTASMSVRKGVASLFADSTLLRFRRQGVHAALIAARLAAAVAAGCDLATAGTQPGSGSQRDYERQGFQVAYTKIIMSRD